MKYQITCVGKFSDSVEGKLFDKYLKRIKKKIILKEINIKNEKNNNNVLLDNNKNTSYNLPIILLDVTGEQVSTEKLCKIILDYERNNIKKVNFIIGGPYGNNEKIRKKANKIISFGKMTWPHLMIRIMLIEQIYRLETIFNNHPYHK